MAISEAARADLYTGLADVLVSDRAEILMSAIPLHDLDEVATKADLKVLSAELRAEWSREIAELRKTMTTWLLTQSIAIIGAIVGVAYFT